MKRHGWILVTLLTVLLTGVVLTQADRLGLVRTLRYCPRRVELRAHARADDPFSSEAAFRWRHNQATHWRACLLQR